MDKKKILLFAVILIIAISALSAVSAAEKINLLGIDFSIPDGYKESPNSVKLENHVSCIYTNELNDSDIIKIIIYDKEKDFNNYSSYSKMNKTTIGGHEGYIHNTSNLNLTTFEYITDGKTVQISANNEKNIEFVMT